MVGGHEHKFTRGDLMNALVGQVFARVSRELTSKLQNSTGKVRGVGGGTVGIGCSISS